MLDIKLLFGAKREACTERESSVQVYIVLAISSKTNHHLFSLQNCRRAMGYNLVKVLIFKRVICGKRHQRVAKKEKLCRWRLGWGKLPHKVRNSTYIHSIFIKILWKFFGLNLVHTNSHFRVEASRKSFLQIKFVNV